METRTCQFCGKDFIPNLHGNKAIACHDKKCQQAKKEFRKAKKREYEKLRRSQPDYKRNEHKPFRTKIIDPINLAEFDKASRYIRSVPEQYRREDCAYHSDCLRKAALKDARRFNCRGCGNYQQEEEEIETVGL